jgi:hypothetical protein
MLPELDVELRRTMRIIKVMWCDSKYLNPVLKLHLSASVYTHTFECLSGAIVGGLAAGLESIDNSRLWYSAWCICLDRTVTVTADVISHHKLGSLAKGDQLEFLDESEHLLLGDLWILLLQLDRLHRCVCGGRSGKGLGQVYSADRACSLGKQAAGLRRRR